MYKTNTLSFAVALVTLGYRLVDVNKVKDELSWHFENKDQTIDELQLQFMNDELTVPAKSYFNNIKMLKNMSRGGL